MRTCGVIRIIVVIHLGFTAASKHNAPELPAPPQECWPDIFSSSRGALQRTPGIYMYAYAAGTRETLQDILNSTVRYMSRAFNPEYECAYSNAYFRL